MGALANAALLRRDPEFRAWCETAGAYVATQVFAEATSIPEHSVRLRLAIDVSMSPQMIADQLVTLVATHVPIATKGGAVAALTENEVIARVQEVWTPLAKQFYPQG